MTLLKRLFGKSARGDEHEVRLFLEAMLIMIAADGSVEDSEMAQFMAQIRTRPELSQIPRRTIDVHMQEAFAAIRVEGIERRIQAIARGLRHRDQRLAAVGMALAIAVGDGALKPEEATILKMMQAALGLSDEDVRAAIEAARAGSIGDFVDEGTIEEVYIETMMLMAAADGMIDPAELDRFGHELAHQSVFDLTSPEQASIFMERALSNLTRDGVEVRLEAIGAALEGSAQRETAFRLALEMCLADGNADVSERALLKLLQERLGLSDAFVGQEIQKILGGPV